MTLTQLKDAVLSALGDGGNTTGFYTPLDAETALNAAQTVFALASFCIERTGTHSIPANTSFDVLSFSDMVVPLVVRSSGLRWETGTLAQLQADNAYWMHPENSGARAPRKYAILGARMIAVAPKSTGILPLSVTYAAAPAVIGTSPEIPAEYHPALVQYAIARLRIKEGGSMLTKDADRMREFWVAASECAEKVRNRCRTHFYDTEPPVFRIPDLKKAARNGR
jgi:hypothetical protein